MRSRRNELAKAKAKSKAKASPAPVEPKSWEDMVADARLFDIILVVFILLSLYAWGICRRSFFSPADAQGVELKREYTANACTFDLPKGSESQKKTHNVFEKTPANPLKQNSPVRQ